jgi:outer membrane protein assembly factor BamD (BamD/ComL family)
MGYRIKTVSKPTLVDDAHLLSGMERFWLKVEEHRRAILGGIILAATAVVAVGGVIYYDKVQNQKAMDLARQAAQLYLDRPIGQPAQADENLKKAIALYRQVLDQYSQAAPAQLVMYELGNALMQANDLGGAIEVYKKYLATFGANKTLLGLVHQRLAFAYLLNGDRDQAAKHFGAVLEVPGALNKDQALFELGKLEEAQSRPEGALARYQDLTKNYPNSPFATEADVRIKALGGKKAERQAADTPAASPTPPAGSTESKEGK